MSSAEPCVLLPWDSDFFGLRIAQVQAHRVDESLAAAILNWCRANSIDCVYFLAEADDPATIRQAEDSNFRFVDVRMTFETILKNRPSPKGGSPSECPTIRSAVPEDVAQLVSIARTSHAQTRFYFDPGFPSSSCDSLYETWIRRSCEGYAEEVRVAVLDERPIGFVTCHAKDHAREGQIGLVGISREASGRGVGQALVDESLGWFADRGVQSVSVVTQGRNIAAQRLYQRCGFLTKSVQLWYHRWFRSQEP